MDFDFTPAAFNSLILILREESAAGVPLAEEMKEFSLGTLDSALGREKKKPGGILIRRLSGRKFLITFAPSPRVFIQHIVDLLNYQEHVEEARLLPTWWSDKLSISALVND